MAVNAYNQFQFSKYVPRSYQELAAPIMQVAAQEEELQNIYAQNLQKAAENAAQLDPNKDVESYNLLNSYISDIQKAADDLATKGFVDSGRKENLLSLQKRYLPSYVNISNQLNQRAQAVALQQQMALKDPTYKYKSASDISIDEAIKNPNIWNDVVTKGGISGMELQRQVALQADAIKQTISQQAPQLLELKTPSGEPLINEYIAKTVSGASLSDVTEAINKNVKNKRLSTELAIQLSEIVDNVMDSNQVHNIFDVDSEEYKSLRHIASQGLYRAIGDTKFTEFTDKVGNMRMQAALEKDLARYRADLELELERIRNGIGDNETPLVDNWYPTSEVKVLPERKEAEKAKKDLMALRASLNEPGLVSTTYRADRVTGDYIGTKTTKLDSIWKKYKINPLNPDGSPRPYADLAREIDARLYEVEKQDAHNIEKFTSFDISPNEGTASFIRSALNNKGAITNIKSGKEYSVDESDEEGSRKLKYITSGTLTFSPYEGKLYIKKSDDTYEVDLSKINKKIADDINTASYNLQLMYKALEENNLTVNDVSNPSDDITSDPNKKAIIRDAKKILNKKKEVMNELSVILFNQK